MKPIWTKITCPGCGQEINLCYFPPIPPLLEPVTESSIVPEWEDTIDRMLRLGVLKREAG